LERTCRVEANLDAVAELMSLAEIIAYFRGLA
jgi:hypothetical protein